MTTGFFRRLLMQDPDRRSKILRARTSLRKPKSLGASAKLRLMLALMVCMGFASSSKIALAAGATGSQPWMEPVSALQIFTFLFLMLGPFKVVGPFAKITERADPRLARRIALRATLVSSLALLLAAVLGQSTLSRYGIPLPDLALAGGLILFLVALRATLQSAPSSAADDEVAVPTLNMAITPLALPTIVTPYGVAAVIIFLALSPDLEGRLMIGVMLLAIMLLNLIVMLVARHIQRFLGVFLQILGAVLGIVQVALGIRFIDHALKWLLSS
jgi:multiple antibiotic resistance protein